MIKIAVIDDEERMLEMIQKYIEGTAGAEALEITPFVGAEPFLEELKRGRKYDVLLTDIELPGMSGVELGKIVCAEQPDTFVIFLTSYAEFAADSYSMEAYQYILKQDMEERLPGVLRALSDEIKSDRGQYRLVETCGDIKKIYYKDIIYIEKIKGAKYVEYRTTKGEHRERITLNRLLPELCSSDFIMAERGYIVNTRHITRMSGNIIYLSNNGQLVVSRARFAEVKRRIHENWENCQ